MLYGLYLSATGVMTNAYRQDVIANNIANAETPGFKRDLALFQQRLTEAQERRGGSTNWSDPLLEKLGDDGMGPMITELVIEWHEQPAPHLTERLGCPVVEWWM